MTNRRSAFPLVLLVTCALALPSYLGAYAWARLTGRVLTYDTWVIGTTPALETCFKPLTISETVVRQARGR